MDGGLSEYVDGILALHDAGYRVIPVGDNKVPVITAWPTHPGLTPDEIHQWFDEERFHVGILTGNGFAVIDIDDPAAWAAVCEDEPAAAGLEPTVRTRSGGTHIYVHYDTDDLTITNANVFPRGVDVRGDGGYVVAPPSPGYEWI